MDLHNVPAAAIGNGGTMNDRDSAVSLFTDVLGVLESSGTSDGGPTNSLGRNHNDDGDEFDDGLAYDGSAGPVLSEAPTGPSTS